jgi:hypothetical protein
MELDSDHLHETIFLDEHETEGSTRASSTEDFIELFQNLHPTNCDPTIVSEMLSKEYCQAKLVELCNDSGARKGFHDDLVRMLKHMKNEHQFDATSCINRDTFLIKCLALFQVLLHLFQR